MAVSDYEILGVTFNATADEIRAAYRRAAKTAHPDRGGSDHAFIRIQKAADRLLDEALKRGFVSSRHPPADRSTAHGEGWTDVYDRLKAVSGLHRDLITVFAPQKIGLSPFATASSLNLQAYNWLVRCVGERGQTWDFHATDSQVRVFFLRKEDATLFKLRFV